MSPVLDLTAKKVNKTQFFTPPPEEPLSRNFMVATLSAFILLNIVIFFNRQSIVYGISTMFGQPTSAPVATPISISNPSDLPSFSDSSIENELKNVTFRPSDITPNAGADESYENNAFGLENEEDEPTENQTESETVAPPPEPTEPPIPTEPPLDVNINETIYVAIFNGSGNSNAGRSVERLMERHNFYVKSIQSASSSEKTIVSYKSGQEAYARKAEDVLTSNGYDVEIKQLLSNDYFSDIRVLIGQ
jgi:hypothetical protein